MSFIINILLIGWVLGTMVFAFLQSVQTNAPLKISSHPAPQSPGEKISNPEPVISGGIEREKNKTILFPKKSQTDSSKFSQTPQITLPKIVLKEKNRESLEQNIQGQTSLLATSSPVQVATGSPKSLPPLDEVAIMQAVVKIECPAQGGIGKYIGAGFLLPKGRVITAAHVVMDSASETCDIIFPKNRRPTYFLKGTIDNLTEVKRRHNEDGVDVALINLPQLENYPDGRAIFDSYPFVPYPICESPNTLGDALLHFGYPSNYLDLNYLSELKGQAIAYADINGIKDQISEDQTYTFKSPVFSFTGDESAMHAYTVSRVASFYGDSGGLAFDATQQCILGPHRGGTIGGSEGQNFSIFINLGWTKAKIY